MIEETRTEAFYRDARSARWTEERLARIRERNRRFPEADTLTAHFIHEARNALGMLLVPEVPPKAEDYARGQERLAEMRQALGWFVNDGDLSRGQIEAFLDEVEREPWNQNRIVALDAQFTNLINPEG